MELIANTWFHSITIALLIKLWNYSLVVAILDLRFLPYFSIIFVYFVGVVRIFIRCFSGITPPQCVGHKCRCLVYDYGLIFEYFVKTWELMIKRNSQRAWHVQPGVMWWPGGSILGARYPPLKCIEMLTLISRKRCALEPTGAKIRRPMCSFMKFILRYLAKIGNSFRLDLVFYYVPTVENGHN